MHVVKLLPTFLEDHLSVIVRFLMGLLLTVDLLMYVAWITTVS